jgi:hypothetical protein
MTVAEQTQTEAIAVPARRKRSFRLHYPAWRAAPSLLYYAISSDLQDAGAAARGLPFWTSFLIRAYALKL